jgi:hypothetical protein
MVEQVGAGFAGDPTAPPHREMGTVPAHPPVVVAIEVVHLLVQARSDIGVLGEPAVERCGATPLRPEDHEVREWPDVGGEIASSKSE